MRHQLCLATFAHEILDNMVKFLAVRFTADGVGEYCNIPLIANHIPERSLLNPRQSENLRLMELYICQSLLFRQNSEALSEGHTICVSEPI